MLLVNRLYGSTPTSLRACTTLMSRLGEEQGVYA